MQKLYSRMFAHQGGHTLLLDHRPSSMLSAERLNSLQDELLAVRHQPFRDFNDLCPYCRRVFSASKLTDHLKFGCYKKRQRMITIDSQMKESFQPKKLKTKVSIIKDNLIDGFDHMKPSMHKINLQSAKIENILKKYDSLNSLHGPNSINYLFHKKKPYKDQHLEHKTKHRQFENKELEEAPKLHKEIVTEPKRSKRLHRALSKSIVYESNDNPEARSIPTQQKLIQIAVPLDPRLIHSQSYSNQLHPKLKLQQGSSRPFDILEYVSKDFQ